MKNLLTLLLLISAFQLTYAQETQWCGTDQYNESIFSANPALKTEMHNHLLRVTSGAYATDERDEECIIPVVVHIMHDNGVGNISYEQVQSGIDMLNEDFNRENEDADATRDTDDAPFIGEATDMNIRFELAKIDPEGNCTNGVERRNTGSRSYNADNNAKYYSNAGLNAWSRNYYFNIWIVNSIDSDGGGTILGYAEFPYGGGSPSYGVIIRNDAYGSVGTASGDRTLTHEVGHCLGLLHTFQGSCHGSSCDAAGDYCCDTPPVSEAQWSCNVLQNTCSVIPTGDSYGFDAFDQFENFMSYSPCQNMYSEDQKAIVLGNLESIGFLSNLVNPDHYDDTGVGLPAVLCKAQFFVDLPVTCVATEVQYTDDSYANVTGWNWTFEGGTPATSTEQNPIITYDNPGSFAVELEVTDGGSTESTTVENAILILSNPGTGLPYSENFETLSSIPDDERFLILNNDEEETWELSETVGYSGSHCAFINNRGNNNRTTDNLISGTIDLSGVSFTDDIIFNFKYAYKKRRADDDEWLRFYISKDCGETWALRKNIHGDGLSEEVQSSAYVPESKDEWTQVNITNINATYYTADFRYKFEFENDDGQNIYLDDINLYPESMVGIAEPVQLFELGVYPNPVSDVLTISLSNPEQSEVTVTVLNSIGQEVETVYNGTLAPGKNQLEYATKNLADGIYYIRLVDEAGSLVIVKFVKG